MKRKAGCLSNLIFLALGAVVAMFLVFNYPENFSEISQILTLSNYSKNGRHEEIPKIMSKSQKETKNKVVKSRGKKQQQKENGILEDLPANYLKEKYPDQYRFFDELNNQSAKIINNEIKYFNSLNLFNSKKEKGPESPAE